MKKLLSIMLVLILVAATLTGCGGEDAVSVEDGTYQGEAEGYGGPLSVDVEVSDGKITSVEVTDHSETDGVADPAIEEVPAAIVEKNSTDVDSVSGATSTSDAIKDAVDNALN